MTRTNAISDLPVRAARWSATHPWRAVCGWLLFVAVTVGLAVAVPTTGTTEQDYRVGESGRADAMLSEAGLQAAPTENVLVTAQQGEPLDRSLARRAAADVRGSMSSAPGVVSVARPRWSADRTAVLVSAQLGEDVEDVAPLRARTQEVQRSYPGLEIHQAGDLSLSAAIDDRVAADLSAAEGFSLPVTLGLMVLAFGALVAAGIPVLLAVTSVAATVGLIAPLSHLVPAEATVTSMIVLIGMAVGVDYSLFYLKREREERASGRSTLDAVEIAAETSGRSILVSGGAVVASMAGLFLVGDATFDSLATGAIVVVAVAVTGSITVLPALLVALGRWVDRPRVPLLWRVGRRVGPGGLSRRVLGPVTSHPVISLVLAGGAVVVLAVPALGMRIHSAGLDTLPTTIPEVRTFGLIADDFGVGGPTASLVVRAPAAEQGQVRRALNRAREAALRSGDFVGSGAPVVEVSQDGTTAVLDLAMPYEGSSPRVDRAVQRLRETIAPEALDGVAPDHAVGGAAAASLDFADRQHQRLPLVIGFVLLLTLVMMGFAFRSLAVALVSTLLNLASVGVAFGVLAVVFQHGWGEDLLGFRSPGYVIDWVPLFVLVVLVGLSMDYHVFVLSRVREHVRRGLPARLAVHRGISETAGVVTSAAAVMVSVFSIFATLSLLEMKMLGVGLASAILVDATLIRLVILPAILVLLGERAWWPSRTPGETPRPSVETRPSVEPRPSVELVETRPSVELVETPRSSVELVEARWFRLGAARRLNHR